MTRFVRDQNGVVWFQNDDGARGMISQEGYERMTEIYESMTPYLDLELWDSHEQNIVDVD